MKANLPFLLILILLLSACTSTTMPVAGVAVSTSALLPASIPLTVTPTVPAADLPPLDLAFTPTPTDLPVAAITATDLAKSTRVRPTHTPQPILVRQGPSSVICPILLYHRIETPKSDDPYYLDPAVFRDQMQALKDWGYTTISASQLVQAINFGADLPARPIVLTFDDGDESVYTTAFPIMQEFGFIGVDYIVVHYISTPGYMTADQLKELSAAGWETGSHSMTHPDLTTSSRVEWEMKESRYELAKLLKAPINTFAYPYGKASLVMYDTLMKNYQAGMGLGVSYIQRGRDLWYLWRRPINQGTDMKTFASYLPWSTPP